MAFSAEIKSNLKPQYTKNLVKKFYEPVLREANLYQRVSGYFNSAGVDLYIEGLESLAKNGGKVEFIVSKEISETDFIKIKRGYKLLKELEPLKISERNEILTTKKQQELGNLAFMIAMGRAKVKIALTNKGIFHDKFGIVYSDKDKVFFNGSANETQSGISQNYESISVDCSWDKSEKVQTRIESNIERFKRLWNNEEPNIRVEEINDIAFEELMPYKSRATIEKINLLEDNKNIVIPDNTVSFKFLENKVVRFDNSINGITKSDRKLRLGSDLSKYFESDNKTINTRTTYKDIEKIIQVTKERCHRKSVTVKVSEAVKEYLTRNKYSIEQYKIMGNVLKSDIENFPSNKRESFFEFSKIVQSEVARPLRPLHLRAAYFEYEMARAANFSVPGAGKTAMVLGVFAYLNSKRVRNEHVKRLLVICPINAFDSWKREFLAVFGPKKKLRCIDSQSSNDFYYSIRNDWGISNLVLVNYESLPSYEMEIKKLLTKETMIVFDEVHRIKNPDGKRAASALNISQLSKFRYVLTGTPIPNSFQDIYNFLHILYGNEYSSFFGWDVKELLNPKIREINQINKKLYPFFWRTNKKDLGVPKPDDDKLCVVKPSADQLALAEAIYYNESSSLAKLIRLIQASTNPSLLNKSIEYSELMSLEDDDSVQSISKKDFNELLGESKKNKENNYLDYNVDGIVSPKFIKGINLVERLVSEGKKVLVWGTFVDTLLKIVNKLSNDGIQVGLVYGKTNKNERVNIINEFRDGHCQVLVSNPQTLGESISLHETVHDAVYFEYNFNLTFMLQSRDRIHRLGLPKEQYTRYYYLQTEGEDLFSDRPGFIDQKIYNRLKEKEEIMYDAIDNNLLEVEYKEDEIQNAIKIINEERKRINKNNGRF